MEELKKEFYDIFSKEHVDITNPIHVELANTLRLCADWWLAQLEIKLAKQQADFVKCIPEEKHYKSQIPDDNNTIKDALDRKDIEYLIYAWQNQLTDVHNKVIADIKSKLNKNK
jgi:hypothetical protein